MIALVAMAALVAGCAGGDGEGNDGETSLATVGAGGGAGASAGAAGEAGAAGAKAGEASEGQPFAVEVLSFEAGEGAGHGQEMLPGVVLGPPDGAGRSMGSLDVLSLGVGGVVTLRLGQAVVDGEGPDLIVFENAFEVGGNPDVIYREPGEVSVSDDGERWFTFACDVQNVAQSSCAGVHTVLSSRANGVSPLDPSVAGGDALDLAQIGVKRARFVRIRDLSKGGAGPTAGFDLDAIAVVHGEPR